MQSEYNKPIQQPEVGSVQYSKYEWAESFISVDLEENVLKQLQNGNTYILTNEEFWAMPKPGDLHIRVGYFKDVATNIHHHKVTNDTRRYIIKHIKVKRIVDRDNEKCLNCGSIDCSTCMHLNRGVDDKPGYIVICHSCNHKSTFIS
jgi:hypothetical protein